MELRDLQGSDIFKLAGIVGKLDIKDDLVTVFKGQGSDKEDVEARGMEIMAGLLQTVMVKLPEVEKDLNTFLAELANVKLKDIQSLGLTEYMALLTDFMKKEELKSFLQSIISLTK